jgi:hypothetical protein
MLYAAMLLGSGNPLLHPRHAAHCRSFADCPWQRPARAGHGLGGLRLRTTAPPWLPCILDALWADSGLLISLDGNKR